jgi:hypothetical protein
MELRKDIINSGLKSTIDWRYMEHHDRIVGINLEETGVLFVCPLVTGVVILNRLSLSGCVSIGFYAQSQVS